MREESEVQFIVQTSRSFSVNLLASPTEVDTGNGKSQSLVAFVSGTLNDGEWIENLGSDRFKHVIIDLVAQFGRKVEEPLFRGVDKCADGNCRRRS